MILAFSLIYFQSTAQCMLHGCSRLVQIQIYPSFQNVQKYISFWKGRASPTQFSIECFYFGTQPPVKCQSEMFRAEHFPAGLAMVKIHGAGRDGAGLKKGLNQLIQKIDKIVIVIFVMPSGVFTTEKIASMFTFQI